MLPMGDAKGGALVLMVEILAAGLSGAHFGYQASSFFSAEGDPPGVGQMILAFDPEFLSGGGFGERLEDLLEAITAQPDARLPGARRSRLREQSEREGLLITADLKKTLEKLNR